MNQVVKEFLKYFVIGGTAFIIDYVTLVFCTAVLEIHYLISAALSFSLGLVFNYTLSILWVFSKRRLKNKVIEFTYFTLIGIAGLFWNELFMYLFTHIFSGRYWLAKLPTASLVLLWNFGVRKILLFR